MKLLLLNILCLSLLPEHNSTIILRTGPRSGSRSHDCQGSQVLHQLLDPLTSIASGPITRSSTAPRTLSQGNGLYQIGSGAINSAAIIHASSTTKATSFLTSALRLKLLLVCLVWKKHWIASSKWVCCRLSPMKSTGTKSFCSNSMPPCISKAITEIRRHGFWSGSQAISIMKPMLST